MWTIEQKAERIKRPGTDLRGSLGYSEDTPSNKGVLKFHSRLQKAEISVLAQARTGHIRLAKFLYNRKVLARGAICPVQVRRQGRNTRHLALYCAEDSVGSTFVQRDGLTTDG
jgi:hypothetical protein